MNQLEIYIERHNLDPVKVMRFLQGVKGFVSDNAINPVGVCWDDAIHGVAALEWRDLIDKNKNLKNK